MAFFSRRFGEVREDSSESQAPTEVSSTDDVIEVEVQEVAEVVDPNETRLGVGSRVAGRLSFEGNVRVGGRIEGELHVTGTLVVEPDGLIDATVHADSVIVHGRVFADVTASKRIEIGAQGAIFGNVSTPALAMCEGGTLEGRCTMSAVRPATARAA